MAKHNDNMFRKVVTSGLQKTHRDGISQGAYAMCKVILDKAQREGKTPEEKLEDIIAFCSICVDPKKIKETFSSEEAK